MALARMIYASTMKAGTDTALIADMVRKASVTNAKNSITGLLIFGCDYFLQCLEGSPAEVNSLYSRIISDSRHGNVVLLDYSEIPARDFGQWSMRLILLGKEKAKLILRFSASEEFNPYSMNGVSALKLLLALRREEA